MHFEDIILHLFSLEDNSFLFVVYKKQVANKYPRGSTHTNVYACITKWTIFLNIGLICRAIIIKT